MAFGTLDTQIGLSSRNWYSRGRLLNFRASVVSFRFVTSRPRASLGSVDDVWYFGWSNRTLQEKLVLSKKTSEFQRLCGRLSFCHATSTGFLRTCRWRSVPWTHKSDSPGETCTLEEDYGISQTPWWVFVLSGHVDRLC